MIDRLRKGLVCAVMAVPMIGLCATPSLAEEPEATGYWATFCESGRACVKSNVPPGAKPWFNFNGCGRHAFFAKAVWGKAHGNKFRVTYKDNRWDEVNPGSDRPLDGNNNPKYVDVYC